MWKQTKVIYVGPYAFPNGGAATRRILGNALSLREAGCDVTIATGQTVESVSEESYPISSRYEDFEVVLLGERTAENYPRFLKHLKYITMGGKTIEWLESLENKPDVLILYSGYTPYMMRLIPWCKKHGVTFVFDAVEWYDPPSLLAGLFSPYQWNIELALRYYAKKTPKVIAISRFLQRHYESKGCDVFRIPPTLDTSKVEPQLQSDPSRRELVVSYTGTPGRKDLFDEYLEAVLRLAERGVPVRFTFAGVSVERLVEYDALKRRNITADNLPDALDCRGIVSHEEAVSLTKNADFSLLLRPPKRYAQAGFPTKVVESLAMGTPVIVNLTSDLGAYVHDGVEGILCTDYTTDALVQALERAIELSLEEKNAMRRAAREQAVRSFDCFQYADKLKLFVDSDK